MANAACNAAPRLSPQDPRFLWPANSVWLLLVTVFTVGYGDMYALTQCGRMASITAAIFTSLILAVVVAMFQHARASPREMHIVHARQDCGVVCFSAQSFQTQTLTPTPYLEMFGWGGHSHQTHGRLCAPKRFVSLN